MVEKNDENAGLDICLMNDILARGSKVLNVKVIVPFIEEPMYVFYMQLTKTENETLSDILPDVDKMKKMSQKEKIMLLNKMQGERVWKQIEKAQSKGGEVPEKYVITREQWDELDEILPNLRDEIIGRINGSLEELARNFFDGPTEQ